MKNVKLGERFWIWGHPKNSCQSYVDQPLDMSVTPAESARYFGVKNVYYVPFGHEMDMNDYGKDQLDINKTGMSIDNWGIPGANPIEYTFNLIPLLPNLNRLVCDDFFNGKCDHIPTWGDFTVTQLTEFRERIHSIGLEMWVVLYEGQLGMPIDAYLDVFDGISFWFWSEPTVESYQKCIKAFFEKTPGKRRLIGCYLYNFGARRQASAEMVRYQLDNNKKFIEQGELEGVILHNNNFGGLNFAAYEEAKKWMDEHGNEVI